VWARHEHLELRAILRFGTQGFRVCHADLLVRPYVKSPKKGGGRRRLGVLSTLSRYFDTRRCFK
jgi:hypothetical protein